MNEKHGSTVAALFENSALFAEWRELHDRYGTNAQAMPTLYKAIGDLKDAFRRRAFRAARSYHRRTNRKGRPGPYAACRRTTERLSANC